MTDAALTDLLERGAERPNAPALLAPARAPLAHGELLEFVFGVAGGLRSSGIGRGGRVALLVENGPEAASAFLSVALAATAAPLNPSYGPQELAFYLDDIGADAVIVSATLDTPARDIAAARGIRLLELEVARDAPAGAFTLEGVGVDAPLEPSPEPDDVALILHTSGTTSRPKLVPLTHDRLCASSRNIARALQLESVDRCLNVMPLFHIHGLVGALLASLDAGAAVVCTPGFHQVRFFDWLEEHGPTWYTAVPTMHAAVLQRAEQRDDSVAAHRLRFIRSSSAPLPLYLLEGLEARFGVPVIEAYGMTEAAHQIASNPLPPGERKPGTVGRAAGPELRVVDTSGDTLPQGEVGEVVIRGDNVFSGYGANPEANELAFSTGWFRTGDLGFLDGDGFLTLSGRMTEIINRGGEKIAPLEVDAALLRHDAVSEAVAFSISDPRLGEDIAAAVVLAPGRMADERLLQDFVAEQLAPFKVPRRIVFLGELPKGPTGKVQRVGLAERLQLDGEGNRDPSRRPYRFLEPQLIAIWESVLDLPNLGVTDDFFALGGDSILGAEAVARVRDLVGDPDLPLVSIVRAPTPAAMASEVFARVGLGNSGAVPLQDTGSQRPLFLAHPGDGEVLAYAALARRLGDDQPSYGLRARGLDDDAAIDGSLAELAAEYVADVRKVQPSGPYLLGGFCVGATIAIEMAAQLRDAGEDVAGLVLLDPRFPRPVGVRYRSWRALHHSPRTDLPGAALRRFARGITSPIRHRTNGSDAGDVSSAFERIREGHELRPTAVPATVILSDEFRLFELPHWYLRRIVRRPRRWRQFPCRHAQLLLPPTVDAVAQEIRAALAASSAASRAA